MEKTERDISLDRIPDLSLEVEIEKRKLLFVAGALEEGSDFLGGAEREGAGAIIKDAAEALSQMHDEVYDAAVKLLTKK